MVITHNMTALNTNRQYGVVSANRAKSTEKLTSGFKINRAADDAAGLSISEKMRTLIRSLDQGGENVQHGISLMQIADGELAEVNEMLHRMTELSVQAANGTNSESDRSAIQQEINQIIKEIDRIHETAKFNEMYLFDGNDPMTGDNNTLGSLVESPSLLSDGMVEAYKVGNKYHPAAILDFSTIDSSTIDKLYDKSFSFICTQGCKETFTFTFANGGGDKLTEGANKHEYTVDINGILRGAELIDRVFDVVKNDPPSKGGTSYADDSTDTDLKVSHVGWLTKEGENKLVIYSTGRQGTTPENTPKFDGAGPGGDGGVLGQEIIGPAMLRRVKNVKIQCSNGINDNIWLQMERMDASYIGVKNINVTTEAGALDAINVVSKADKLVSAMRSQYGALQNRLEHTYKNSMNTMENTASAESRLRDTDIAEELVTNAKESILMQATEAMLAQANLSTEGALNLLR